MSSTEREFKNLTLRDIRIYRERIQHFVETTYSTAENAVQNLFSNDNHPDVLRNLDDLNTVLKECREKLITVANAIPDDISRCPRVNQNKKATGAYLHLTVPKTSIEFNKPYLVEILLPGSPSKFWLKLASTTPETIEELLNIVYHNCPNGLKTLPCPGTFVVCLHSGKYCRGKVITTIEMNAATPTLDIILVDYGETITATLNQLYPIQKMFCLEPAHGFLCAVHDLEPAQEEWELDAIVFFNQSCESIKAVFHRPPKDHVDAEVFSNYSPDYYVSLQNRNGKQTIDIRLAMIKREMGRPFQYQLSHPVSSKLVNNEPPRIKISLKENLHSEMASKESLSKTNLPSGRDCGTPGSHPNQANWSASKVPLPSYPENIFPTSRDNSTGLECKKPWCTKPLNVDAKEFVVTYENLVEDKQQHTKEMSTSHLCQPTYESKQTSSSDSADVGRSYTIIQETKFRAIPVNYIVSTKNSSYSPTLENDMAGDIDALILEPLFNRALSPKSPSSDPNSLDISPSDALFREPADLLLMKQFLNCVNVSTPSTRQFSVENSEDDNHSFATPSSQIHLPDNQGSTYNMCSSEQRLHKPSISLDYRYGSSLKPRTSPVLANSNANTLYCCFSHVISPSHFYVHLLDEISSLVTPLSKRLNELYENSQRVPVTQPEVGSFWVVQETQSKFWSRAKILNVETNDEIGWKTPGEIKNRTTCTVLLVDWGNVEVVPICNLRPLVKEILDIPCLALRCRLDGIYPIEKPKNSVEWPPDATDTFIELAGIDQELTALFSSKNLDRDGVLPLLLLKNGDDGKYSVNEQLVLLGFAASDVFHEAARQTVIVDDEAEWGDPMHDDYYSPMNTLALNTENYDSVTTGHIPKDEERICRFFTAKGKCYKGIRCEYLHSNPAKNVSTEDKIEVYVHVPSMHLVSGSLVHIQVTHVINAFRFYSILPYGTRNLSCTLVDEKETLETMQKALQEEYTTNYFPHRVSIAPSAGDIVIARSPEDNNWYRGRVMEEAENDHFGIYFLDYGNAQLVHMRSICNPLPRFVHLPTQGVEMFLNGIDTSAEANTIEAKNVLVSLVKNRDLIARIVHTVPFVCVDLYNTFGPSEIDIASEMIRLKVARIAQRKPCCLQQRGKEVAG